MVTVLILMAICLLLAGPAALIAVWLQRDRMRRLEQTVATLESHNRFGAISQADSGNVGLAADSVRSTKPAGLAATDERVTESATPDGATTGPDTDTTLDASSAEDIRDQLVPTAPPAPTRPPSVPARPDLESIIGSEWLTWIGILAIFFGTAFFLAVEIEPSPFAGLGQVLLGIGVAVAFLVVGAMLQRRRVRFLGHGLLGGGVALLYLGCYAAVEFHHLIGPTAGWILLSVCSITGAALALFLNSRTVAGLTILGAIVTPLLVEADSARVFFFVYVFLVNLAAAFVAVRRGWFFVPTIAFLGSVLLGTWWMDTAYQPPADWWIAFFGITSLWAVHFCAPLFGRRAAETWHLARTLVVFLNAFAYLWFLCSWLDPDFAGRQGLAAGILALIYIIVGAILLRSAPPPLPLAEITHYVGIVLAAIAVPLQFEGELIGIAWGALGLALVEIGLRRPDGAHRWLGYGVLALSFVFALFHTLEGLDRSWQYRTSGNLLSGLGIAAALALAAWRNHRHANPLLFDGRYTSILLVVSSAILTWAVISLETDVQVRNQAEEGLDPARARLIARLTLSLVWAAYGALLLAFGFVRSYRPVRLIGVVVLLVLIGKVFLVDIQDLERGYRIASFLVLGILLLSVSIAYQRRRGS